MPNWEKVIKEHKRKDLLKELNEFTSIKDAGFVFLRGRRRVGKSWLLRRFQEQNSKTIFYFSGKADARGIARRVSFSDAWFHFSGDQSLNNLKKDLLSWDYIFRELIVHLRDTKKQITIIFDEIQWISADGSGFVGSLKDAWVNIQRYNLANIIICGSSNKFFNTQTGGEETILRGMTTRSNIWVTPYTVKEVKKLCLPSWSYKEIATTYMFLGGIPYYLNQVNENDGFVHAINSAIFSKEGIFINEVDEILRLEFNKAGIQTVKTIMSIIGSSSVSQAEVRRKLKLAPSTVSETFDKLVTYGLLFSVNELGRGIKRPLTTQGREIRYKIKDFYLRFYFSVIAPLSNSIKRNDNSKTLLFPNRVFVGKEDSFYIPGFSGTGFENLVEYLIEISSLDSVLLKKMKLKDFDFEVGTHRTNNTQVDIVIRHATDRLVRVIECKFGVAKTSDIDEVLEKEIVVTDSESRLDVVIFGDKVNKKISDYAASNSVIVFELSELF